MALLVRREKDGNKIFKCWTCHEYGHYVSKFPKREKKFRGKFKPRRDKDRNFLYVNEDEEYNEKDQSESDDELGFVAIKEDDLDREIREERALVTQVEKKSNWIIDSGCSHHMTSDMNKFVKFRNHDGGIVRVGNNAASHITRTGSITLDGKTNIGNVYFVDGSKHNFLSVGQLVDKGYLLQFTEKTCIIKDKDGKLIGTRTRSRGNVFQLNPTEIT